MGFVVDRFVALRPFVFHVTRAANLAGLATTGKLYPAADLIRRSGQTHLLRRRRRGPEPVVADGQTFVLQDQAPLIAANAELYAGWDEGDFVSFLNHHVYFWPGVASGPIRYGARLLEHYEQERPAVLRMRTARLLQTNTDLEPLFCAFNSGAPRMNDGYRVPRGPDLFLPAAEFPRPAGKAVEMVFRGPVRLPTETEFRTLDGTWARLESAV
jgi:hypothetical protein